MLLVSTLIKGNFFNVLNQFHSIKCLQTLKYVLLLYFSEKLKSLSEKGLRFVGDKAKTIGQPTPESHPHLMEENESE